MYSGFSNISISEYEDTAEEMLPINQPYILVEGNNKLFYQNLNEFNGCFIKGSKDCESIKSKVHTELTNGRQKYIGIIDNDYFYHNQINNIFVVDYYCIENICLEFFQQFSTLRGELKSFFENNELEDIQSFKILGKFGKYDDSKKVMPPFIVDFGAKHDISFKNYIKNTINSLESFYKYADLKQIVERYIEYHKRCHGNKNKIKHLEDLHMALPTPSTAHVFNTKTNFSLAMTIKTIKNF
ncbi:hypothetical protein [Lactococcus lactis]|uniref:hypothetical protein n=1 Tax=Lactococcus lactis TaxID=1358 RepID=UPI00223C14DD|nr:hypothetical protein [Lactococcus lactis]MCT1181488.1 hypothetical protein [Lactococcus lactis]